MLASCIAVHVMPDISAILRGNPIGMDALKLGNSGESFVYFVIELRYMLSDLRLRPSISPVHDAAWHRPL